ncbi:MAG TPA: hypothetical protein VF538_09930 [Pyrinomonadaceae bacterium]
MSSFLVNIIRKGAGLPQEAPPRPSAGGLEGLPPADADEEDAAALLTTETDATFEDEPQPRVEKNMRAHRPDSITEGTDEASSSEPTRARKAAPVAREKRSDGDVGGHARGPRDAAADFRAAHEESESLSPRAPAPAPDDVAFRARPAAPRFTREPAHDERADDFSARPSSTETAHPEGDGVAATISENARTAERRSPFAARADERASGGEEGETAESFPYADAARIVPRAQEPGDAGLKSSALAGDAASRDSQGESPRVEVRIGTVEVRMSNPTPQPPAATRASAPRGFESYTAARRYLDRKWY